MIARRQDERGATAILVGIMAVLLFSVAALAVDLGNAWSRKRVVQKQVDVSALGAGYLLPMTGTNKTQIAQQVADLLNADENRASGQPEVTAAALIEADGDLTDGQIFFQHDDGTACTEGCTQMRVVAPEAHVDFGFAGIMGYSGTAVQQEATVRVFSALPPKQKLIPFWLPSGCGYGPADADTRQGGGSGDVVDEPEADESDEPDEPEFAFTPAPSDSGSHVLNGSTLTATAGGSVEATSYVITGMPNNTDRASLRFYAPDGTWFIDYAAQPVAKNQSTFEVPDFTIDDEVTGTAGNWRVYALVFANDKVRYSTNHLTVEVQPAAGPADPTPTPTASPSDVPIGCVGQDRGNFGQLLSPRLDGSSGKTLLSRNLAGGLDHLLQPFQWAVGQEMTKDCGKHTFITGAWPDNVSSSTPPRNCIVSDTGNDGPGIYDGLITGVDSPQGRLDGRLAATNGHTSSLCNPARADQDFDGVALNNDLLSCFLRDGATLGDIASETGVTQEMLDPRVIKSPRFVWLPMVVATDRAQKDFQPILDFVPAFITHEPDLPPSGGVNGVDINGNSVDVMRVFTFNKDALPVDLRSPTIEYDPAGRSIVRLVG